MKFTLADRKARQLDWHEVEEILLGPNLLRLGFIDERDGSPVVHLVWFYYENEMFFIAIDTEGTKARWIRKNPKVYFVVDVAQGPPRGARSKSIARVSDDHTYATEVTKKCAMKYLGTAE